MRPFRFLRSIGPNLSDWAAEGLQTLMAPQRDRRRQPSTAEEFREERLAGLLLERVDALQGVEDGGMVLLDRRGRAIAVGWGWDPASDLRIDHVSTAYLLREDPLTLVVDLPAPRQSLRLRFPHQEAACFWHTEFSRLIPV